MSDDYGKRYREGRAAGFKGTKQSRAAAAHVDKDLGRRQNEVREAFRLYGAEGTTACTVAVDLEMETQHVRSRVCELIRMKKLFDIGSVKGRYGRPVQLLSVVEPRKAAA